MDDKQVLLVFPSAVSDAVELLDLIGDFELAYLGVRPKLGRQHEGGHKVQATFQAALPFLMKLP